MVLIAALFWDPAQCASPQCLDRAPMLARSQPSPLAAAHDYVALSKGKLNWGVGPCFVNKDATQCRQLCDADPTCIGFETGTSTANTQLGFSCCLEFCRPPDADLPFPVDAPPCACWTSSSHPPDETARVQWTYHLKGALLEGETSTSAGAGSGAPESCSSRACNSRYGDCCANNGELQSCKGEGLYAVSVGTCGSTYWYGRYTCCPLGAPPPKVSHTVPREGNYRGFGFWQM